MASNRHLGRIIALQSLYELEFRVGCGDETVDINEILDRNLLRFEGTVDDTDFVRKLVLGTNAAQAELDELLRPIAPDWPIEQIARIDRNILRLALYELKNNGDVVPPKVAINEAVELAKAFGSDNSSKFVNGVLGTAYRTLINPDAEDPRGKKAEAKENAEGKTEDTATDEPETSAVGDAEDIHASA